MELFHLRAFETVARTGNLTKAAHDLHLSQSALSMQVKNLEEELGVTLFVRQAKGMRLSTEGETLLPLARTMLAQGEDLVRAAHGLQRTTSGALTIGLNTDPTFLQLTTIIRLISSTLPQVCLHFSISQTLTTETQLKRGEMDMGFAFGTDFSQDITVRQLTTTPISVVVPRRLIRDGQTLSWTSIAALPWIWTTCQCPFHVLCQERMDEHDVRPNTITEAVDENIVKEMAMGGMGVALLRKNEALDVERQGVGMIWEAGELQVPLCLTWLARRNGERLIKTAAELVAKLWAED